MIDSNNFDFEVWDKPMRKRLYAFWVKDIFDDEVIFAADPVLKEFAKRLPALGIDQCATFEKWCGEDSGVANDYRANPEVPVFGLDEDDEEAGARQRAFLTAPEPDPYDDWMAHLQQVRAEQALAALMKSKAMRAALATPAQPSAVQRRAMPEAPVSGQTAAAQHTSTGGSDEGDPDPADQIIPDPCKTDPRILAHGDNPTARSIRKAILAIRQGIQHPAASYCVQRALAEMVRQVKHRVRCMPYHIPADIATPLIQDAALSLLHGLAKKHDFRRVPNPNFYKIVQNNIRLPANLREVANRVLGTDSKPLDMLDVEAGLARAESVDLPIITRLQPTLDEDGEVAVDAVDSLQSLDIQDDPFRTTWVRELADAGQRPNLEDDPDGAMSSALAAMGAAGAAAFDSVRDVLKRVAGLSDADCRARACAIFAAMDFLDGCDTVQHRVEKLQTVATNARGSFPPDMQRAAISLLEGAGYPA